MTESRFEFAVRAREMEYRAVWLDSHKRGEIPPIPPDWDSSETFRYLGKATVLRSFAMARHYDAYLGNPPSSESSKIRQDAVDAAVAVLALQAYDDEVQLAGQQWAHRQARTQAARRLGQPLEMPPEVHADDPELAPLIWFDADARDRALRRQVLFMHEQGIDWYRLGQLLDKVAEDRRQTRENTKSWATYTPRPS